jgi:hypothetical protein
MVGTHATTLVARLDLATWRAARDELLVRTYSTTGRGNEPANGSLGLLDMTPYGRREAWEDNPEGWPEAPQADSPVGGHGSPICWYWRSDADGNATWGPTSRPVPQWTRPGATPVETLGRHGPHH